MPSVRPVPALIEAARLQPLPEALARGRRAHDLVDLREIEGGDGIRFDIRSLRHRRGRITRRIAKVPQRR